MRIPFRLVDVFTDRPLAGNQFCVVPDPVELSSETMLAVTREIGFSETTFMSEAGGDRYAMRIFTPGPSFRSPGTRRWERDSKAAGATGPATLMGVEPSLTFQVAASTVAAPGVSLGVKAGNTQIGLARMSGDAVCFSISDSSTTGTFYGSASATCTGVDALTSANKTAVAAGW